MFTGTKIESRKVRGKLLPAFLCCIALGLILFVDSSIDYRISLLIFYILPVGYATIRVGPVFATILAITAVIFSKTADLLAGMPYPGLSIMMWNGAVDLLLFLIAICLLRLLNRQMEGLEATVRERTQHLLDQMSERGRLEREITELSEREHRRLGHELHDLICHELAGIAIDSHLLTRELFSMGFGKAEQARAIAVKVDRALTNSRNLAKGFVIAGFDSAGLVEALEETARQVEKGGRISCFIHWQKNLALAGEDTLTQVFRIAQEAIRNAVQHAAASRIEVRCECTEKVFRLTIEDNGRGFSSSERNRKGLGLSIMAYRASLLGGEVKFERPATGGTRVICEVPSEKQLEPSGKVSLKKLFSQ